MSHSDNNNNKKQNKTNNNKNFLPKHHGAEERAQMDLWVKSKVYLE